MTCQKPEMAVAPVVVAQRLCDLLLSFPSAAMGGVQWSTLVKKYEERHATRLDLAALGHMSALAAATALLWDVLRLVDAEDTDNPVVAVEDAVVMSPRPGLLGTWPSLYKTLCKIVQTYGSVEPRGDDPVIDGGKMLLLSQLKPLLQMHWHANFDERGLGYLSDEGTFIRLKKMKHLVQAVLRWRELRRVWRSTGSPKVTEVDEAVALILELEPSTSHNDLVLRLITVPSPNLQAARHHSVLPPPKAKLVERCINSLTSQKKTEDVQAAHLKEELEQLRRANAHLRSRNEQLEQQVESMEMPQMPLPRSPTICPEVFDDPFEPPPEMRSLTDFWASITSPASSTHAPSDFSFHSGSATPLSVTTMIPSVYDLHSGSTTPALSMCMEAQSGAATPIHAMQTGFVPQTAGKMCALVPVWFPAANFALLPLGDRGVIPNGIVQQARAFFETSGGQPSQCPRH